MVSFGYKLSSEEHGPLDLIDYAVRAEEVGFEFAAISDHFHPWTSKQGHSPFVWGVIGGIARATDSLKILTGVTCPTMRMHPVVVAHAAATAAVMLPDRFTLGVGSGENLNEHVTGSRWPELDVRLEMLEEAIAIMRLLWKGGLRSHHGRHYNVENARLYDLPDSPIPIAMAASGKKSVRLAARVADALVAVAPDDELAENFRGGHGRRQAALCRGKRVLGFLRSRGSEDRVRMVAGDGLQRTVNAGARPALSF